MNTPALLAPGGCPGPQSLRKMALGHFGELVEALASGRQATLEPPGALESGSVAEWRQAIAEELLLFAQTERNTLRLRHPSASGTPPPPAPLRLRHPSASGTPPPPAPLRLRHPSASGTPPPPAPSASGTPPPPAPLRLRHPSASGTPPPPAPLRLRHPSASGSYPKRPARTPSRAVAAGRYGEMSLAGDTTGMYRTMRCEQEAWRRVLGHGCHAGARTHCAEGPWTTRLLGAFSRGKFRRNRVIPRHGAAAARSDRDSPRRGARFLAPVRR